MTTTLFLIILIPILLCIQELRWMRREYRLRMSISRAYTCIEILARGGHEITHGGIKIDPTTIANAARAFSMEILQ